jgi:hypothetical protein
LQRLAMRYTTTAREAKAQRKRLHSFPLFAHAAPAA